MTKNAFRRPKPLYATSMAKPQPIRPAISAVTATTSNATIMNRHGSSQTSSSASGVFSPISSPGSTPTPSNSNTKKDIKVRKPRSIVSSDLDEGSIYDDDLYSEELRFLYRLFVPNKYRIKNNKQLLKHLLNHLPRIIPNPTNLNIDNNTIDLNFQVHLFLSTIMVKFVNSWYFTKLNTNNVEFVNLLYQIMCDFVKDFSKRINEVIQQDKSLELIDEFSNILNGHLNKLVSEPNSKYAYKIVNDYYEEAKSTNSFKYNTNTHPEEVVTDYLHLQHIVFDQSQPITEQEQTLNYLRVIFKQILQATFESDEYSPNPLTSEIATNFVTLLMCDLVLNRLVEKLSSPEFILVTVVNTIVTKLIDLINGKNRVATQTRTGWSAKLKQFLNSSYHKISDFIVNISYGTKNIIQGSPEEEDIPFDVFDNSLVKLINTITNFSERKPLVTNFLTFIRSALKLNEKLNMKVNSICSRYIANKIKTSLTEDFISGVISDLRIKLFYPENNSDNEEVTPTVNHITDKFIDLYQDRLPQLLGGYVGSNLLKYDKESDQEQRESIKRMLMIFNSVNIKDEIGQPATRMNKLLIMKVLDCIVAILYPELL